MKSKDEGGRMKTALELARTRVFFILFLRG